MTKEHRSRGGGGADGVSGSELSASDLARAAKLVQRILERAHEKGHTAKDLSRSLDIHVSHWYRVRSNERLLASCDRQVLARIAAYLDWPLGRVYLSAGILAESDLAPDLSTEQALRGALAQLEASSYSARLSTPLGHAATDHRLLIAELFVAVQAAALRRAAD